MQKRKLGSNGPELTAIGLGSWAIGGPWAWGWGQSDDEESIRTIQKAIDLGINWIDTAAVYGLGHSEEIVGQAIKGIRDKVYIATKCGLAWNSKKQFRNDLSVQNIRNEVEASLKRLQVETIDLYQFHWPDKKVPVEKSWEVMVKLKKEGKIRWLGVSNFSVELLERCEKIHHIDSLQPQYNLFRRDIEKEALPWCLANGVGVVAYSPMFSGMLTGSFDVTKLAGDDWRKKNVEYREPKLSENMQRVEKLRPIAEKYGKTIGQLAVAWVLKHPAVTSAIVGARRVTQVEENLGSAGFSIAPEDIQTIEELFPVF
ncbi:MAG TPA: aldo/keto reductase [bacterium]|nr:aldo/keto reductase [bacterium]HPN44553.1 aldo/keto reductase [bacterium]